MNTTTHSLVPAASRAGVSGYSADASAARSSDDFIASRSFEEMCPEEGLQRREEAEPRHVEAMAKDPKEREPMDRSQAPEDESGLEKEDEDEVRRRQVVATDLVLPCIVTTASLCAPAVNSRAIPAIAANPAENAEPTNGEGAAAVVAQSTAAGQGVASATASKAATVQPGAPTPQENQPEDVERKSIATGKLTQSVAAVRGAGRDLAGPATASATATTASAKDTAAAPIDLAGTTGGKGIAAEETTPQPAAASRSAGAKGHAEKSAGLGLASTIVRNVAGENKFLSSGDQGVTTSARVAGTRAAFSAGTMQSTTTAQRNPESLVLPTALQHAMGLVAGTEGLSVDRKGWTIGGGEPGSTAAQSSHLSDKPGLVGLVATPATSAISRTMTPPAQPTAANSAAHAVETAEALAPIHSAIERLVLHGRDQLALTVRFEQGGSLSIKLAMNNGEIATHIQTDVPGLESALKSSWGELAQDWNSRGWKLSNPEFTSSTASYQQRNDASTDGRAPGRQARDDADQPAGFGGRAFSPARLKHGGPVLSGLDALRAAALARRGIHTWA